MILVTGCNSFIGKKLVQRLHDAGMEVRGMDRWKDNDFPSKVHFMLGDVLDFGLALDATREISTVFHLMDVSGTAHNSRRYMRNINIRGTENILKAAHQNGVSKIVYLSSAQVYGKPHAIPIREEDRKKPVTRYGADKLKAEMICYKYMLQEHMDISIVRPGIIVGPGVDDPLILLILYMMLAMGDASKMYIAGNGDSIYQLVHADDVIDAMVRASTIAKSRGKTYNIGSDNVPSQVEQVVKIKEMAQLDCSIKHISPIFTKFLFNILRLFNITILSRDYINFILQNFLLDCDNAKNDLGWRPTRNNIEMIVETIEWYKREKL